MSEKGHKPGTRCLVLYADGDPEIIRTGQEVTAGNEVHPPGTPVLQLETGAVGVARFWCQDTDIEAGGGMLAHPIMWLLPIGHDPDENLAEDELMERFGIKTDPLEAGLMLWHMEGEQ